MTNLDIPIVTAEPNYDAFIPTVRFRMQFSDANLNPQQPIMGGMIDCNVFLKGEPALWLGKFTISLPTISGNMNPREINENFHLGVDVNSAMFDHVKTLEGDDITFNLVFTGYTFLRQGQQNMLTTSEIPFMVKGGAQAQITKETNISVEKWRKLISKHYRNLTWISISRETYSKLKKMLDEKGITPDELLSEFAEEKMK